MGSSRTGGRGADAADVSPRNKTTRDLLALPGGQVRLSPCAHRLISVVMEKSSRREWLRHFDVDEGFSSRSHDAITRKRDVPVTRISTRVPLGLSNTWCVPCSGYRVLSLTTAKKNETVAAIAILYGMNRCLCGTGLPRKTLKC